MPQEKPYVYQISKIKNTAPRGIIAVTVEQKEFDEHRDYVNLETGEMYADYYVDNVSIEPSEKEEVSNYRLDLSCSLAQIKVGGGYKLITATCFSNDIDITTSYNSFNWSYEIIKDGVTLDATDLITELVQTDINKIKIKLNETVDESYLGSVLLIHCSTADFNGELFMSIVCL